MPRWDGVEDMREAIMPNETQTAETSDVERLTAWFADVAEIMARLDHPDLGGVLDAALARLVSFDLSVMFAYPAGEKPLYLFDGFRAHDPGEALNAYLNGAYLLDPFYTACARRSPPGLYRMRDLAPDEFFASDYVNSWEVHPCISMQSGSLAEEIGYLVELPNGVMLTYSLMRSNGSPAFSDAEFAHLRRVEPVVRQALRHHLRDLRLPSGEADAPRPEDLREAGSDVLERAFQDFGADTLSVRERMVVQMILRGHSALSIATTLDIAEGTVKNHRKNIYSKLSIASQQELFSKFITSAIRGND